MILASRRLNQVQTYYFASKLAEIDRMNQDGNIPVINLGLGSPDLKPHPEVIDALQNALLDVDAHKYQPYKGLLSLREAFAEWYKIHFSVDVSAETDILPLIGSKEGVMHISMAFLDQDDEVLVPNSGYPSYSSCTLLAGGKVIDMPLESHLDWKPNLDQLQKLDLSKVKLLWINYPNMPTGATTTLGFFEQLVSFALKNDILICHDNPYAFLLNDNPISIFNIKGAEKCALELVSMSKCYNMAGWRVGAIVGAKTNIDTILKFKSNMDSGMFKPIQKATITALSLGKEWIDDLNNTYRKRKDVACQIMEVLGLSFDSDGAGLFVWGKINDAELDAFTLADKLLYSCSVFITPGTIFGTQGSQYLRISLCSPVEDMEAALYRIKTSFDTKIDN